ncbi:LuxR C-terminal-related transcriptional regulator [Magnetospirillum aberrantis]|uniref:Response regulator transcription factor n=1 Tax=Magnetospirillum aberrantis SpK TaxID=908842 RepID=A0A7C9QTK5_9PROT|nr:response regulator transcription factor [Magnetospirillum aberrantis]NFV80224.1 response regulator transcription factor [Magnetospirillum aberrantis SpK]
MRILLADDHAMVRDGLVPFLERLEPGASVVEAGTFPDAQSAARTHGDFGLAILDLYMPGMNGLEGLLSLRSEFPTLPIVILSGSTKPEDALQAIESGANGFVPKTMRGETILGVLRLVLSGEKYIPPFLFDYREGGPAHSPAQPPATGSPLAHLTPRERDILEMIVDGAPNKVIARELNLQEVTVKAHLRNMFRKLTVANRTEAARVALLAGVSGRKSLQHV